MSKSIGRLLALGFIGCVAHAVVANTAQAQSVAYTCTAENEINPIYKDEVNGVSPVLLALVKGKTMSITIENKKKATINPTWLIGGPLIARVYRESTETNGWGLVSIYGEPPNSTVHVLFIDDYKGMEKVFVNGRQIYRFTYAVNSGMTYGTCIKS